MFLVSFILLKIKYKTTTNKTGIKNSILLTKIKPSNIKIKFVLLCKIANIIAYMANIAQRVEYEYGVVNPKIEWEKIDVVIKNIVKISEIFEFVNLLNIKYIDKTIK